MKSEIIAVGSEMLGCDRVDTNSLYVTDRLNSAGFRIHFKSIVGDVEQDLVDLLAAARRRSELVIVIGGLGPTEDDITRVAVARSLGRPLVKNAEVLQALSRRFALRGYTMSKNNERQAEIIEGAEILENPVGTAPGMWIEDHGVRIVLLPGPPRELKAMFDAQVVPRARALGADEVLVQRSFRIIGMTESGVDSRVAPVYGKYPRIQTTILASTGYIGLRLQQWLRREEGTGELDDLAREIRSVLGDAVFTTSEETIEEVVGGLLKRSGLSLAVAESCTSGMIGMHITRVPGSSEYFRGGILCYSNEAKRDLCGVSQEILQKHGAVSPEAAEALARGVRRALHSSIGLSVTGIAGPGGGTAEKPVGLVYVGLADAGRISHKRSVLSGDRDTIRERAAFLALSFLRKYMITENLG